MKKNNTSDCGAVILSVSSIYHENVRSSHLDTLLDFVGFITADCVQHYEEGLKPEAVAKLHFSETEVAAYCVCSTKLLVGEMDEDMFKKLEAGKVGSVLIVSGLRSREFGPVARRRCGTPSEKDRVFASSACPFKFGSVPTHKRPLSERGIGKDVEGRRPAPFGART